MKKLITIAFWASLILVGKIAFAQDCGNSSAVQELKALGVELICAEPLVAVACKSAADGIVATVSGKITGCTYGWFTYNDPTEAMGFLATMKKSQITIKVGTTISFDVKIEDKDLTGYDDWLIGLAPIADCN